MPRFRLSAVLLAAAAAGCTGRDVAGRVPIHPVGGTLVVSDRPAGNAHIAFHAIDRERAGGTCPVAVSKADGTFALMTYAVDDGAPEGEYVVTVTWPNESMPMDECECPDPSRHDRLGGLYADARTSELRATVGPGRNEVTLRPAVGGRGWNLPTLSPGGAPPVPERRRPREGAEQERARAGGAIELR